MSRPFDVFNTFSNPDKIKTVHFTGTKKEGGDLVVKLPAKSIVVFYAEVGVFQQPH